ncbi:MAG: hypothetical protein JW753_00790 [Dehalococcoidia bacterium]|nr:hypothetical protein [Dehalococcoidia bacterium]
MNEVNRTSLLSAIILILSFAVGCGMMPQLRTTVGEASAIIGPAGGTIEISHRSSPLCGVKVDIPEDALLQDIRISVNVAEGEPAVPDGFVEAGRAIQLGPEGTVFRLPVTITIPYVDEAIDVSTVRVWKSHAGSDAWLMMSTDNIDPDLDRITVRTYSFSSFNVLATEVGANPPSSSPAIDFNPSRDGLTSRNTYGTCYGEVAFVQWFWENKRTSSDLVAWHSKEHSEVAKMAHCTTSVTNPLPDELFSSDGTAVAESLMWTLWASRGPAIVSVRLIPPGALESKGHAVLVYGYEVSEAGVEFFVYDPNSWDKKYSLTYDGIDLTFPSTSGGQTRYGLVQGFYVDGHSFSTRELEFVYEYFENPPEITDATPTGVIGDRRPMISAVIRYPFIDGELTSMTIDGGMVDAEFERGGDHKAKVSFTPREDLGPGLHRVSVSGSSYVGKSGTGQGDCAPPIDQPSWTFLVGGGETWNLTLNLHLPAFHMAGRCIEINYISEDYEAPGGEADLDLEQMGAPAWVGDAWGEATAGDPVSITVTRDGDIVTGSFDFTHAPSGYTVAALLSGTIVGDKVSFKITYRVPQGLQEYSMPWRYSDQMSELDGSVYYSTPAELIVGYEGTVLDGSDGKTIAGAFNMTVDGQIARWRFHEKEYSCAYGYVREKLLFDGTSELTFSNVRLHGDFTVSIEAGIVV